MDVRLQTSLVAAVVSLALAASVLVRSRKRRDQWLFGAFGLNVATWYFTAFLATWLESGVVARINLALGITLPLSAVAFFAAFVGTPAAPGALRMKRLRRAASLVALVLLVLTASPLHEHIAVRASVLGYVVVVLFTSLALLYKRAPRAESRFESGRLRFLAVVGSLAGVFALLEYLPYLGLEIPAVGTILVLVFLYMLSQSVLRYRLIDLYELSGRLIVLTTLAFVLAGILWGLVSFGGGRYFLHAVVASLVVLLLFDPVRSKLGERLAQLLFRERHALEQSVAVLRRRIARVLEVEELGETLMNGLEASRRVTHACLYLADVGRQSFQLLAHAGPPPPDRIETAPARPLLDRLGQGTPVVLDTIMRQLEDHRDRGEDREAETLYEIAQTMQAMNTSVCLALRSQEGDLYGILGVRDERMLDAFAPEEVQLLAGLAAQAAISLENSRLYQELEERDRLAALGEMAAGLAHEIRNPLGAIKASAQYLTEDSKDEHADEFLHIIVEEVDRLNRVVGSFLDYAKPASGDPAPTDLDGAVERTVQLLGPECQAAGVELEVSLAGDLPLVRVDAEQLRQVLLNLVRNAVEAVANREERRVKVRTMPVGDPPREVLIHVEDTGGGIPAHVRPNLFVPFVTTKQKGTGLGLAISHRIVTAAGGRIEVRNNDDGATFVVRFPVPSPAPPSDPDPDADEPALPLPSGTEVVRA